jgi:transglutaminase-like putative cysteine protease
VTMSHHAARLRPRDTDTQRCLEFSLSFEPEPDLLTEHTDSFGNQVACFSVQKLHKHFEVISRSFVSLAAVLQPDPLQTPAWESVAAMFRDPVPVDLLDPCQFVFGSPLLLHEMPLRDFALPSFTKGRPVLAAAADLCRRIHREFVFDPKATTISTPLNEVLEKKRGVCQDFAHLAIADVSPVRGIITGGGKHTVGVGVDVEPVGTG